MRSTIPATRNVRLRFSTLSLQHPVIINVQVFRGVFIVYLSVFAVSQAAYRYHIDGRRTQRVYSAGWVSGGLLLIIPPPLSNSHTAREE